MKYRRLPNNDDLSSAKPAAAAAATRRTKETMMTGDSGWRCSGRRTDPTTHHPRNT